MMFTQQILYKQIQLIFRKLTDMKLTLQGQKGFACTNKQIIDKLQNCIRTFNDKPGFIIPLMNTIRYYGDKQEYQIFKTEKQISTYAVSAISNHIAIGQASFKGQLTTTYLLKLKGKKDIQVRKFTYQKTKTDVIAISPLGRYICAAGSSYENQQQLVFIDTLHQESLGTQAIFHQKFLKKEGRIVDITFSSLNQNFFVVVFSNRIVFFQVDQDGKIKQNVVKASRVRQFNRAIFNQTNQILYACSKNGDISEINVQKRKQIRVGPRKRIIISGIYFIKNLDKNHFVISGAKGFLALIQISKLSILIEASLKQQIASFSEFNSDGQAFISTNCGVIYKLNGKTLDANIFLVTHNAKLNDIAFVSNFSKAYATCAGSQITIWKRDKMRPLIRIQLVRKITCNCIAFDRQGSMLFSGWSDGCLRIFSPINGKQLNKLENCLNGSKITAIMLNGSAEKIATGGDNGLIRFWSLQKKHFGLIQASLSNHKRAITQMIMNQFDLSQFISGSEDGTFGVWNIDTFQLISMGYICSFIRQITLSSKFQLKCVGSTSNIFTFLKSSGQIISAVQTRGSHINSIQRISHQLFNKDLYILGGQLPNLIFYNQDQELMEPDPQQVLAEITKLRVSPDCTCLVVGTVNGSIFQFALEINMKLRK